MKNPNSFSVHRSRNASLAAGSSQCSSTPWETRRKLGELDDQLGSLAERIQRSGGLSVSYEATARMRIERNRLEEALQSAIERIHATGCIVKDLDIGLLDFPSRIDNQDVYLCWRLWRGSNPLLSPPGRRFFGAQTHRSADADYQSPIQ